MRLAIKVFLALVILSGCATEQESGYEKIKKGGVLRVGTDATYPPFEYNDDNTGEIIGFDIDLMKALCAELGLTPRFIVVPFGGIIPALRSGKYDCIISAMTITPERLEAVDFTRSYYKAGQSLAVPVNDTTIKSITDLKGKKVGVQLGTTGEIMAKNIEGVEVISFNNIGAAFIDMENGRIDAVLNDYPTTKRAIAVRGWAKIVGPILSSENYGIAVAKSNERLLSVLNAALDKAISNGVIDSLKSYWGVE
jgi:ABC-type amino acid transport substrate-binding protein